MKTIIAAGAATLAALGMASASPVTVEAYDMLNGTSGSFSYWDESYDGTGNVSQNFAPLAGGTGDLTDGVIDNLGWFDAESPAGPGPYVGWTLPSVDITFHFAPGTVLDDVTVWFADSNGLGGVNYINRVTVNNQLFFFGDPGNLETSSLTIALGGLATQALTMTFAGAGPWIFISEVEFTGSSANPVPVPGAALLLGSAVPWLLRWKRQRG